jgi:hypothetical protein
MFGLDHAECPGKQFSKPGKFSAATGKTYRSIGHFTRGVYSSGYCGASEISLMVCTFYSSGGYNENLQVTEYGKTMSVSDDAAAVDGGLKENDVSLCLSQL